MGIYFCILLFVVIKMAENTMTQATRHPTEGHQEHPLGIYLAVWILLFVLSTFSYMVDILELHGLLRWFLIVLFMLLKAGLIIAIFMHMAWERLVLIFAILLPPLCVTVFLYFMATEGDHTFMTRLSVFGQATQVETPHH
jgi:cytochrome c oxidase subunit 4